MLIVTAIISVIIIIVIMAAAVITTSKAYSYKHTIDPIENNPNIKNAEKEPSDK
ncbi:YtzI protein [Heyndrickxia camelliae]|uniref:YtzI protein n=1 Tax=Heyndrickxia camelliae TaxID=1707093 RepID=A0A2N3LIG5_9BACI|nr:YtzI protein [Heyndrickxia camelliae]PKR84377.1 YtzI protein [Heyndrickxia camelliae]